MREIRILGAETGAGSGGTMGCRPGAGEGNLHDDAFDFRRRELPMPGQGRSAGFDRLPDARPGLGSIEIAFDGIGPLLRSAGAFGGADHEALDLLESPHLDLADTLR